MREASEYTQGRGRARDGIREAVRRPPRCSTSLHQPQRSSRLDQAAGEWKLTYASLVRELATILRWEARSTRVAIDEAFMLIASHVFERGDELRIPGLGTFYRLRRKKRTVAAPPGAQGSVDLSAQFELRFRPAQNMRRKL